MSFFTEIAPQRPQVVVDSNVLGATGLSRQVLATMFRRDGLFGTESSLSPMEQAVIQDALGIRGLPVGKIAPVMNQRLHTLKRVTWSLMATSGHVDDEVDADLAAHGYRKAARQELVRVVRIACHVFAVGVQPRYVVARAAIPGITHALWA